MKIPRTRNLLIIIFVTCISMFNTLNVFSTTVKKSDIKSIRVVMDDNYPPYSFRDDNGNLQGITIDQWKLFEKKTGIKVDIFATEWSKAYTYMKNGEYDVIDTISFNEERTKIFDYSKPYATIEVPIFFNKNISGITGVDSLKGFTVAAKRGDNCINILKDNGITNIQEFNNAEDIIQAAKNQNIVVFVMGKLPAQYYLYKLGIQDKFNYTSSLYTSQFFRAVNKGNTELLNIINDGFSKITFKEIDEINKKWYGTSNTSMNPQSIKYLTISAGIIVLILLLLLVWNRTLSMKVTEKTAELSRTIEELKLNDLIIKKQVNDLEAKNAEMERFTYTVSHDLKSPLITIKGFSGILIQDIEKGKFDRVKSDVKKIQNAADRMQELLDDLLQLSRIGRIINPNIEFSMTALSKEVVELLQGPISEKGVSVFIQEDMPSVFADYQRIKEVVQNLLENSIRFMDPHKEPTVQIGCEDINGLSVFFVKDNGPGIDSAYHEKIFGLFNKLDPNSPGTGIGLALVKRIVELHNGEIWVQSELGSGAAFYFTLNQKRGE